MKTIDKLFKEDIFKKFVNSQVIKKYYGIVFMVVVEVVIAFICIFFGDKLYIAVNDNLDSNIVLMKMFKDNNCWLDRTTPLPFLGGLSRDILTCGYTLQYLNYWFFDIQAAYWINLLEAILISGFGFYFLGKSCGRLTGKNISPNLFCIVGVFYSLAGFWPTAIIGFSLIPWWAFLVLEIYRTKKWWLMVFFIPLLYNISGPLIGIFLIFYTIMFSIVVTIKEKKFNKEMTMLIGLLLVVFVFFNRNMIFQSFSGSKDTIKGLASQDGIIYDDSFIDCLKALPDILLLKLNFYHLGATSFQNTALLLVLGFFVLFNLERKNLKIGKDYLIIYNMIVAAVFFNACAKAFDECAPFRKLIPFLSGFTIHRFMWLSPFIISMGFLMIIYYFSVRGYKKFSVILVLFLFFGIVKCKTGLCSIYNHIHVNYITNVKQEHIDFQERWDDFFKPELFDKIKQDIGYNGEWVVSYAMEPSIAQYNGFKTLDGYYSNYPVEYKKKWEKMIMPTLLVNDYAMNYWRNTNGQRAYIYTTEFLIESSTDSHPMLIEPDILRKLGGKYILSKVKIENANELNFEYLGTWDDEHFNYHIIVYKVGG